MHSKSVPDLISDAGIADLSTEEEVDKDDEDVIVEPKCETSEQLHHDHHQKHQHQQPVRRLPPVPGLVRKASFLDRAKESLRMNSVRRRTSFLDGAGRPAVIRKLGKLKRR